MDARTVVTLVLLATPALAGAATVDFASDADFLANAQFTKTFGAQSRWGNGATNGDWEVAVVNGASTPLPGAQRQVAWATLPGYAGNPNQSFRLSVGGGTASYTLYGGAGQTGTVFASSTGAVDVSGINALALRARTDFGDVARFDDVRVYFSATPDFVNDAFVSLGSLVGDGNAAYRMFVSAQFAALQGFTIVGDATLRDGGGSLPMYEFKLGTTPIPLPAAAWLLLSGLVGLGAMGRRRQGARGPGFSSATRFAG